MPDVSAGHLHAGRYVHTLVELLITLKRVGPSVAEAVGRAGWWDPCDRGKQLRTQFAAALD